MTIPVPAVIGLGLAASVAQAHAVLEREEASPGATYRGGVQILHGCDGKPTTTVSVGIPEGLIGAKPMPKPGWTPATTRGAYAKTSTTHHGTASEGVTTITWSGGSAPDVLTGAAVPFARTGDVHAMSMEGGVMTMAPVSGGLAIKPGETVELRPGGNHLMFEGLTGAPKAGETVARTLTFQRAGTVPVTFSVAPIGASAPGGQHQHPH